MKQLRPFPRLVVTKKAARSVASGQPWVFEGEVLALEPAPATGREAQNGDVVDVVEQNGTYLGTGLLSQQSKIRARIVSTNANDRFDQAFWDRKARWAWEYRLTVMGGHSLPGEAPDTTCCRVLFSEADGFPGLTVDRYNDVLVAQVTTVGMDRLRPQLYEALLKALAELGPAPRIRGVYERCDGAVRDLEGLPRYQGWWVPEPGSAAEALLAPEPMASDRSSVAEASADAAPAPPADTASEDPLPPDVSCGFVGATSSRIDAAPAVLSTQVVVQENGISYALDLARSQKTGFFLDQKYNRRAVARLAQGRRVLDCFSHVGPFGLNAAAAGARFVRCVDVSQAACDLAQANARLNGLQDTMAFTCANVFEYLDALLADKRLLQAEGGPFDLIVLDPPAFAKSRAKQASASRGYREINNQALRLLPRGGYLATCSCSHHMPADKLKDAVAAAARDARVRLRQVEERQQAPDHPILWGAPETHYLDFLIFQVI